jgi:transcriptional regulator with XRE-family HTH domain
MSEPDPKTTLRQFREYFARSYESQDKIAARVGVTQGTLSDWLAGKRHPKPESLAKLRAFLNTESKRNAAGKGIRPIERAPFKITKPAQQVRYARICPFCRKSRGRIKAAGRNKFHGTCTRCGAIGPARDSHQEALRAWNGRE